VKKIKLIQDTEFIISLAMSIILAFIIGAIIILANGKSPIEAYASLINGSLGSPYKIANTFAKTVPLVITGLATAVAFRSGIYNIGGEGQLYLGAFATAYVGFTFTNLPAVIGIPVALVFAALAGALYALVPALLKVKYSIDEVITTIMFNSIAVLFTGYLANYPFSSSVGKMGATEMIAPAYKLARLVSRSGLHTGIFFTMGIALVIYYMMDKTSVGYDFKMIGSNLNFAKYGGINAEKNMVIAMLISGGLCGIAGAFEVLGNHYRFLQSISPGYAFDGMLVSLIVKNNVVGVILMSIFFGMLKTGSIAMEYETSIPSELVLVIQSIIILFIAGEKGFARIWKAISKREGAKHNV
jgi:ABC-type uncharacterized transport system permease subunit